jgi:RNA polymerase sigma-70 factor, ECF subfamily
MGYDVDQRRFLELYLAEQDLLRAFMRAIAGCPHDSAELFQEFSGVLWEAFPRYDPQRPFRAWALGVARLEALKWRQRHARRREVFSDELLTLLEAAAVDEEGDDRERRLGPCLQRLSAPARTLLQQRYLDGQPVAAMAKVAGRTVAAIEMALVRIRRALRACIEGGSNDAEEAL